MNLRAIMNLQEIMNLGDFKLRKAGTVDIYEFWNDILEQNADRIRDYFDKDAYVNWHCTNEHFNVDEFIIANCEYPGNWDGEVERLEKTKDLFITVTHVYTKEKTLSFHVTSFIQVINGKIAAMDEYWADDGIAPDWRRERHIGKEIL